MQDPLLGHQLGNYRLVEVLGQGSFAQVYRGKHVHINVFAAIKVLHTQFGEQERENFRSEAELLNKLRHEHIIRFLDYGFISGRPYLITDLAEKGSLNRIHPRGTRLPLQQIVGYVEQIAAGLDFAHTQRVIHRDVKPENILVSDTGALLLADFGIAKLLGTSGSSYLTSSMSGTLPYMAPELFDGRPSPPSDQYALGVMVYEWLTGRFPFDGSAGELVKHHLQDPPPPLRSLQPSISPEIELVVQMALRKEPGQRFRTMQAFANALRQASITRPRAGGTQRDPQVSLDSQIVPQRQKAGNPPQPRVANPTPPPPGPVAPKAPPQRPPLSPAQPRVANPVPPPSSGQPVPGGLSQQNRQPLPSDPQSAAGASGGPLPANRQPLASDPQSVIGASGALLSVSTPLASDPANKISQPIATDPTSSPRAPDADEWQKLLPPRQSLPFTQLPALPQALLSDFWWPTFIVAPEQRREINQGTISSEMLSALGPLTSFPSLSVPLPVSSASKPLSIGRLDAAQRISSGMPASSTPASRPRPVSAPVSIGTGRVAPAAQAQSQASAPAQPGLPRPAARTAQAATAGAKQPKATTSGSSAAGAVTIAIITIIIGLFCTIGAASAHTHSAISAVIVSWICLLIGLLSSSIGINQAGSRASVKGWLIFFLFLAIVLAIINIPIISTLSSLCC